MALATRASATVGREHEPKWEISGATATKKVAAAPVKGSVAAREVLWLQAEMPVVSEQRKAAGAHGRHPTEVSFSSPAKASQPAEKATRVAEHDRSESQHEREVGAVFFELLAVVVVVALAIEKELALEMETGVAVKSEILKEEKLVAVVVEQEMMMAAAAVAVVVKASRASDFAKSSFANLPPELERLHRKRCAELDPSLSSFVPFFDAAVAAKAAKIRRKKKGLPAQSSQSFPQRPSQALLLLLRRRLR